MIEPRRGEATPPIALPSPSTVTPVLGGGVALDDAFVARLRDVCASVSVEAADLAEHSRDWWPLAMTWALDSQVAGLAGAVARVSSIDEVAGVLRLCNDAGVPVTASAGRSGVCGSAVPVHGGVVLDVCGLHGIVDVDRESMTVDVRAGTFGDVFEDALGEIDLTVGHWPQSMALSTVGGWLACRSAGQYSNRYGKIEDIVVGLDVVLADGRLVHTGGWPRAAVGPDLTQLFVGSDGTLGVITGARLRCHSKPAATWGAAFGFASFADGLDACRRVIQRGGRPAVLRLYDQVESKRSFEIDGRCVLLAWDEADPFVLRASEGVVVEECVEGERLDDGLVDRWFSHRNDVSALEALVSRGYVLDTIEVSAPWSALAPIYTDAVTALSGLDGVLAASAHQSHAYVDGACLYFTFAGSVGDDRAAKDDFYRAAWDAVTWAVRLRGGALSHHHGVGVNRGRYMRDALGAGFDVLAAVKSALDPRGVLNPGKLGLSSPWAPDGGVPWP
ncbi:MAG TPA: FAD-binding oxidoreductase [Acidimicrobiales bacterium]|nr:FAD-binding oxidoreductase [Acidimicrobiales bacterium]